MGGIENGGRETPPSCFLPNPPTRGAPLRDCRGHLAYRIMCTYIRTCTVLYGQTTRTVHPVGSCLINRILCKAADGVQLHCCAQQESTYLHAELMVWVTWSRCLPRPCYILSKTSLSRRLCELPLGYGGGRK